MSKQTYRICCFHRKFKLKEAEAPNEIKDLFSKYSEHGIMTAEHLYKFLNEVQGEDKVTKEEAESVLEYAVKHVHEHLNIVFHRKGLNLDGFFRYLFSDANSSISPHKKVHHDMTAPLSHYFIYTSHNTYLTGNQLNSDCSDVPIIKALQRGIRVIELDMWPNSSKDNVDILHGGTLTPPVELIKCLKSIKEYAFVASEYPVILTLEDHLTPNLQAKVAEMVTQIFGDMLFTCGAECLSELPSPESLKGRIIISTKPPKEYLETRKPNEKDNGSQKGKKSSEEKAWGADISELTKKQLTFYENKENGECQDDEADSRHENSNLQQNTAPEYKHLIAIQGAKSKGPASEWLNMEPTKVKRVSLGEEKLINVALHHGKDLIRFTQRNLLRVYPKGIRVDSSNYNPLIGWMHGAQMVAFNMQGHGRPLWLMQGMFRANGGCGYVKKPELLLKAGPNNEVHDPKSLLSVKTTLKVKIYMGRGWHLDFKRTHFDIYSPPDFYVKIGIAGVPADSIVKKTRPIEDNWIPTWDDEFEFPLSVPEIALLRVEVHEYDMSEIDDFGGQTCIPVSELRTGIRAVPIHDEKGEKYPSVKLLMRVENKYSSLLYSFSEMASTKLRRSCSFPILLLSFLNFILFILSAASVAPIVILKTPPTSLGWAFLVVSTISLLSCFIGFYSQLTNCCFITHVSLLLASCIGQLLAILALFTKEKSSLSMLKSPRDPREAKVLVRLECGVLMAMFVMQLGVLVLTCAVQSCWVRDYEGLEGQREAWSRKRNQRIAKVQEESMANATKISEMKAKELDEKMKNKYGQWVKTDFEG